MLARTEETFHRTEMTIEREISRLVVLYDVAPKMIFSLIEQLTTLAYDRTKESYLIGPKSTL